MILCVYGCCLMGYMCVSAQLSDRCGAIETVLASELIWPDDDHADDEQPSDMPPSSSSSSSPLSTDAAAAIPENPPPEPHAVAQPYLLASPEQPGGMTMAVFGPKPVTKHTLLFMLMCVID